jgi:hypothetical protein
MPFYLTAQIWEPVGQSFSGLSSYFSLNFDSSNTPYVASKSSTGVLVSKFNGGVWENVGSAISSHNNIYFVTLAFDGDFPYVAFVDNSPGVYKARVKKFNGSNWEAVGEDPISIANATTYLHISINAGQPYLAFARASIDKISVIKFNGTSWENVGNSDFSQGYAHHPVLRFLNNIPYVAYADAGNGGKMTLKKLESDTWVTVGTGTVSDGNSRFTSFEFDGETPYIAYKDYTVSNKIRVKKFDGSNWITVGQAGFSEGEVNYTSLSIVNGKAFAAYSDHSNDDKVAVMAFDADTNNWSSITYPGLLDVSSAYENIKINSGSLFLAYTNSGFSNAYVYKLNNYLNTDEIPSDKTKLFPNPVADQLNLIISSRLLHSNYEICDINGKVLFNGKITEECSVVDTNSLQSGVYFFKIITGSETAYDKFIKQ